MGNVPLAYPMRKHKKKHTDARVVVLLFDGSYRLYNKLNKDLDITNSIFRFAIYKQKDKFRDAYDEYYYHQGIEKGKTFEKRQRHLRDIQDMIHKRTEEALQYWKSYDLSDLDRKSIEEELFPDSRLVWDVVSRTNERLKIAYEDLQKQEQQKEQKKEEEIKKTQETKVAKKEFKANLGKRKIVDVEGKK